MHFYEIKKYGRGLREEALDIFVEAEK